MVWMNIAKLLLTILNNTVISSFHFKHTFSAFDTQCSIAIITELCKKRMCYYTCVKMCITELFQLLQKCVVQECLAVQQGYLSVVVVLVVVVFSS